MDSIHMNFDPQTLCSPKKEHFLPRLAISTRKFKVQSESFSWHINETIHIPQQHFTLHSFEKKMCYPTPSGQIVPILSNLPVIIQKFLISELLKKSESNKYENIITFSKTSFSLPIIQLLRFYDKCYYSKRIRIR